jgi:phospholipid/cholesterol/gamma-HCH transport system permease protein
MEAAIVEVGARLDRGAAEEVVARVQHALDARPRRIVVDLATVTSFDSAGIGAVVEGLQRARGRGVEVRLRGLPPPVRDFLSLLSVGRLLAPAAPARPEPLLERIGGAVEPLAQKLAGIGATAGQVLHALLLAPRRGVRLDRTVLELDHAAHGALPIVTLIGFLLGLILAMQAWVQLRIWGAEIYIADMVGVSVLTEIGPLMTAIVLAARSGSSNAAQLGAMVVGEEIDALRQMGIHPLRFLVVPKVLALAIAALLLVSFFDLVAVCGGALFAWLAAGIQLDAFQEQLRTALLLSDFAVAALKTVAFGVAIGIIGCSLGLRVTGGSEGVGRATTESVVISVFTIIVVDALFVTAQRMVFA